ncbi:hypothetical protein [Salinarimonas rosea]|uniref:hypothetical protein n=1 Tax=Salinarimonas rosea TaxID=552063 RepID=UPI00040D7D1A|nr:hypothetical protein [Salinarimonas rosea]
MIRVLALLAVLVVVGCARTVGDFCDVASPIRLEPETIDRLTDDELDLALAHNDYGAAACSWSP